jgi:hypothetical protein
MFKYLTLLLTLFMSATLCIAQDTSGRIVGTVNASDGVIAGATVIVTDNQKGKTQTLTTSENGTFTVGQLEFGTYTVRISAPGFKTFVATDVKVDAGRERTLDALLEVGAIAEEVTVTAGGGEAINATNAELSTTISQEQIRELPLNTRNPLGLLNLIAGANATTNSINGQRSSSTDYRRDGLNVQDNYIRTGGFVQDQPTVDDTAEFSVTTQNAGVEQGGGSSLVSLVTPRGGSDYHGALYIFNRNSEFTANSFTNNERGLDKPFLNRNQFGGSLSGRLPFFNFGENDGPLFTRDKSFFFVNYEGFRLAQQVTATGTTLLPAARTGDFTFTNSAGQQTTINVLSGSNFNTPLTTGQGGVLPVDPIIQARILSGLPTTANGITTGTNFLQSTSFLRSDPLTRNSFTSRFDYDFNDRNSLNFVYRYNNQKDARTDTPAGFSTIPFVFQGGPTNLYTASYRITPTSNFSNEFRVGYQSSEPFFQESNIPTDFLIGVPLVTNPEGSFRSQGRTTDYRNVQDNAVYTRGNHSFRFGGQAEWYKITASVLNGITPTYAISNTANPNTPGLTATQVCGSATCINATDLARANSLRYLLGGIIGGGSRQANLISINEGYGFGPNVDDVNYKIFSGYVSDQWRLRPNFTLNLGIRYEYYTPLNTSFARYVEPVVVNGDLAGSIQNPNGTLNVVGGNAGSPGNFSKGDKDNFAPSVSFAYSPRFDRGPFATLLGGGTVLRGGFRLSYVNDEYVKSPLTLVSANRGLGAFLISARDENGLTTVRSSLSPLPGFNPLPTFTTLPTVEPLPISYSRYRALGSTSSQLFGVDPNLQLGRVYEWNIGFQREIGFKSVFEIRYVGNMSNDLIRTTDFNEIDIRNNGFLDDFRRAQGNLGIYDTQFTTCRNNGFTAAQCTATLGPRSAGFNPAFAGSQQLPVFGQTANPTLLVTNQTFLTQFEQGAAGAAAQTLIINNLRGNVVFQPNPHILVSEIVSNAGKQRYNALQAEIRRRFSNGFSYQVNYTFQKTLTDVPDDSQNRQGELQDGENPALNYGRPDYDRTHTVNANMILELPFGRGKKFLNQGGWVNAVFGGFQFTSIVNLSSGPPLGIVDPRGTSSIAFKSGRQSATSSLSPAEIKALTGVFDTPNGRYFMDPRVLNATITNPTTGEVRTGFDLFQQLPAGFNLTSVRAASPFGQAPFAGQVFFFNNAGETGNLPRNFINGLPYINWDAGLSKNIRIGETMRLQLRAEAFNVLNSQVPFFSADLNVNSDSFGRITTTYNAPRVMQFGVRFDF